MQTHKLVLAVGGAALALVLALFMITYYAPPDLAAALPAWAPRQDHSHDLERRGGSYIVLRVDVAAAGRDAVAKRMGDVREALLSRGILFTHLAQTGASIGVRITDRDRMTEARLLLRELGRGRPGAPMLSVSDEPDQTLRLTLADPGVGSRAVDQDIAVLRRRAEAAGAAWPMIARQGDDAIVVKAPGVDDPARLAGLLAQSAKLSFRFVDNVDAATLAADITPVGDEVMQDDQARPMAVRREVMISGDMLADAAPGFDVNGRPSIDFRFNAAGAQRFAQATSANIGKRFAIVVDGRVLTAPYIMAPITGGAGEITGAFTQAEVSNLAMVLRSGPLPAPLTVVEQRRVR